MKCNMAIAFCLMLWFNVAAKAQNVPVLTESFDSKEPFKSWSFSNGSEFPGSEGALVSGPGLHGAGAVLSFRFSCSGPKTCGHYVAASRRFAPPLDLPTEPVLRFWANVPREARLAVRLTDETGQTLQYSDLDPSGFEQTSNAGWKEIRLSFRAPANAHWGGLNNGIFHGRLSQLAVLANASIAPSQSQLRFDDLSIGSLQPVELAPSSSLLNAPDGSAVLGPLLGVNLHSASTRTLEIAKEVGFSFVRIDLNWEKVEQQDYFDFENYDSIRVEMARSGLGVLWLLGYGHPSHGGKYPKSDEDREAFGRFAAAAAEHFRGPDNRFEIWNEPDNTLGDPKAFALIVQAAAEAIRKSNPNAEVSSGGISEWSPAFFKAFLENCDPGALSAIGFHGYRDKPETVRRDLGSLQAMIAQTYHRNLMVWDTEWGYSSYPKSRGEGSGDGHSQALRLRQAVLGTRELLCAWASGFPVIVWYDLLDDNDNPLDKEGNFGMLNRDLSPKPVFSSVKALTQVAKSHHYVGLLPDPPSGIHAMQLEGNLDTLLIIWNDDANVKQRLQFKSEKLQSVSDLFGNPVQVSDQTRSDQVQLTLAEADGPIYVQFKK